MDWGGRRGGERGWGIEVFHCGLGGESVSIPGVFFFSEVTSDMGRDVHRGICLPRARMFRWEGGIETVGQ